MAAFAYYPPTMKKFLYLTVVLAFTAGVTFGQSPSPAETPGASPAAKKHKHAAKKEASASPAAAESPAASPAAAKHKRSKKEASPAPSESPAVSPAASPAAKHKHAAKAEASPAANASASASPSKPSWFERLAKGPSASASPAAPAAKTTSKHAEPEGTPAPGGGPGMVWVNTETHVYHKEGDRWYGRTKKGKYMSESEALKEGNRAEKEPSHEKKK